MKKSLLAALCLTVASVARAGVDCSVSVRVDNRITALNLDQQVGAERLRCVSSGGKGVRVHVVRMVKTAASARADASASASGSASASFWESCTASCSGGGSGSCSTSSSGSDSCSGSGSDSASSSAEKESVFTVAWADLSSIEEKGYTMADGGADCELQGKDGETLDALKAVALVTWIYGENLMKDNGADLETPQKLSPKNPTNKGGSQ